MINDLMLALLKKSKYQLYPILLLCFLANSALAQNCTNDSSYYSIRYEGPNKNNIIGGGLSSTDELVTLGMVQNGDNFMTKFSKQGNILWSNSYKMNYVLQSWNQFPWYTNLTFTKMVLHSDTSYFVIGREVEHGETINGGESPPSHNIGVLLKLDKFGLVRWCRSLGAWYTDYSIENIQILKNGNILLYVYSYSNISNSWILCLSPEGNIIWSRAIITQWPTLLGATHAMKEIRNGNIVVADEVFRNQPDTVWPTPFTPIPIPPPLYYFNFFGLDQQTGKILWDNNYRCSTDTGQIPSNYLPDIKNITESPDGTLSFFANMYMPVPNTNSGQYIDKAVNIITDNNGVLINTIAYHYPGEPCRLVNIQNIGDLGEQLFLSYDSISKVAILTQIDNTGQIEWSKAYNYPIGNLQPSFGTKNNSGRFNIFLSQPDSKDLQLLISNTSGKIPCLDTSSKMIAENTTWPWKLDQISMITNLDPKIDFGFHELAAIGNSYPFQKSVECQYQYTCCVDFVDSTNITQVPLCQGIKYTLPDNTVVSDSGRYYVTFKGAGGCDSTVFFQVTNSINPSALKIVSDTCLAGQDSITLHATEGFANYTWTNLTTNSPYYTIYQPGIYTVNVNNICGSKTDSVHVYDKCNFPITMPNAFTPNNDGKNDIFKIPVTNKNSLISFSIFNRYGQKVFSTNNISTGWNGYFNNDPQPEGTYVYFIKMRGLNGKEIDQNGTVILFR
jgi:gliding motility-associated-like protein